MSWLKKIPWLSLSLLLITYAVFGWLVSQSILGLAMQLVIWGWCPSLLLAKKLVWLGVVILVLLTIVVLAAPLKLIRICFGSWLESDTKAIISILAWALAAVLITTQIQYCGYLLVLIASGLLAHLDLQTAGCNKWQSFILLTLICLVGFSFGSLMI